MLFFLPVLRTVLKNISKIIAFIISVIISAIILFLFLFAWHNTLHAQNSSQIFFTPILNVDTKFTGIDLKNSYTPPFVLSPYFEFYGGGIFSYKQIQFSLAAGFFLEHKNLAEKTSSKINFFFNQLDFQYFGNVFSFAIGKNNYVWGEGYSYRFAFPYFPLQNIKSQFPKDEYLWNTHFDWFINSVSVSMGSFFDTQKIDRLQKPDWASLWTNVSYNNELFTLLVSSDYRYDFSYKKHTVKSAVETKFVFSKENHSFSLYNTLSSFWLLQNKNPNLQERFRYLLGYSHLMQFKKSNIMFGSEIFYKENFGYVFYSSFVFWEFLQVDCNWLHILQYQKNFTAEIAFLKNGWEISFAYVSKNFAKESAVQGTYIFEMSYEM